jgi:L-Ala-D/L-Glu epimerase
VKVTGIKYQPYQIPFRVPFTTSRGSENVRRGLIVRMRTDSGLSGLGEAVALTTFGTGTFEDSLHHVRQLSEDIAGNTLEETWEILDEFPDRRTSAPARFAIDTAALDVASQAAGVRLSQFLQPDADVMVPINTIISDMDSARAASAASYAALAGYPAIKMKVGAFGVPGAEIERIAAVRNAIGPDVELRLDVNGSWSLHQAIEMAERLAAFDIAYLEQPLPVDDLDGMAKLRQEIGIRVAADEAATSSNAIHQIIQHQAADVLIIKPGVVGGLRRSRELIELAERSGLQVVVTTALEAGIGITAALHLASTLSPPIPACGLATGALLEDDLLVSSPRISGGRMAVPDGPGLGVELSGSRPEFLGG